MPQSNKNAGADGIIEMLSLAGACAALTDKRGRIISCTPSFTDLSGGGDSRHTLDQVFDGSPRITRRKRADFRLTLKASGKEIMAKAVPVQSRDDLVMLVVRDNGEKDSVPSEEQIPTVYASNDLIFQFNSKAKLYYVSSNAERITGYRADEFISGKLRPLDIVHPDDRPKLEKDFKRLFSTHRSIEDSEHRIVKKNGEIAYLLKSWYVLFDSKRRFNGIMGLNKDITKDKLLRERVQLFHSAFEHSTDAIVIAGVDGKIVDVNDAFISIYGFSRKEAIGKTTSIIRSRHSTEDFYRNMWTSLDRDNQWRGEILNRRKDGTEVPIWLSITPIYLGDKKIGYMGIESDMSEQKSLEQQIIQTEKLATIGQLAAGIAHEIGTPLNIISGNAEYVLLDMKPSDPGHRELEAIIEQTKRMTVLMRQLLDFARPKVLSLRSTDVNSVLKDVLSFTRLQFKKKEIRISTNFDDHLPTVYGDPSLLYQVFLNVIMNAFQAMKKQGVLTIQTRSAGKGKRNKKVRVEITDTGEGIPPEHLEKIFVPFFTTKEPGKGTGLGLAVTRRIVQEHDGTIDIKSKVGKGTTVTILFSAFVQDKTA